MILRSTYFDEVQTSRQSTTFSCHGEERHVRQPHTWNKWKLHLGNNIVVIDVDRCLCGAPSLGNYRIRPAVHRSLKIYSQKTMPDRPSEMSIQRAQGVVVLFPM